MEKGLAAHLLLFWKDNQILCKEKFRIETFPPIIDTLDANFSLKKSILKNSNLEEFFKASLEKFYK